jgi:hypothetical protein
MAAPKLTEHIILAAIQGFESQKTNIDQQIAELRAMLSGGPTDTSTTVAKQQDAVPGKRKRFSAAARRRMAEAQKARWAKLKDQSESASPEPATTQPVKAKRKLSAAGRKAISEATKTRWARQKAAEIAKVAQAKNAPSKKTAKGAKKVVPVKRAATKKSAPATAPAIAV